MSDSESEKKSAQLEPELRDMKLEEGDAQKGEGTESIQVKVEDRHSPALNGLTIPTKINSRSTTHSPVKQSPQVSPSEQSEREEMVGGEITLKIEPGKAPKLSRTASSKIVARPPPLYLDLVDATDEAVRSFDLLSDCTYGAKYLGNTEHALECDCAEEWDPATKTNNACGEDSDCINRATKMECVGDCGCGSECQNQRFQRKQYANVTVIKTEKKGYGLRANTDLKAHDFIFEYIGEVINEGTFRRRMIQYDEEGIKHFYFMSLSKGEFVDATKKGNLGRFCNHSCNPNCYVDKWVIGDKLRMGIFAERNIKAGEELVFNYNVDRYGADPQPCYCGEPNCTGYIGGKTQTDRSTKLSHTYIEALGIDDGDGWDSAVAKKPRKKKVSEDDEEYVNDIQPKSLEESGVTKVMAALMQCKEKWIAVKLLSRIQRSNDEKVGHRVIRMHGYTILKTTITAWMDDFNVVLQVLDILDRLPRITRNKIQDSKIEETIEKLKACGDERVETQAAKLLEDWSKLEVGYRIPRMKRDPNASTPVRVDRFDRREKREKSKSKSRSPSPKAPSGPRSSIPQRNVNYYIGRPAFRRGPPPNALPPGWHQTTSENGATYYYSSNGVTQWQRPTMPAAQPPPPPPKEKTNQQRLQEIIQSITQNATPRQDTSASATPQRSTDEPKQEKKEGNEKWRKLSDEKRMKVYENTLFPHVKSVTDHYRKKLEKDDIKRLAKEVAKKLVRGDFKANRVQDPTTKISSKHEKFVKKFVKEFMDKAVAKKIARDKEKAARAEKKAKKGVAGDGVVVETPKDQVKAEKEDSDDEMLVMSDDEDEHASDASPDGASSTDLKRKRDQDTPNPRDPDRGSPKKSRTFGTPPAPPPPPPPPAEDMPADMLETGFTPNEDIADSFHAEAIEGVIAGKSPMQLATPPTTTNGSCEDESIGKDKDHSFGGHSSTRQAEVALRNGS